MKSITVIILLLLSINVNAQYNWSNPSPAPRELFGIHFLDSLTGWTVGNFSTLLKTTDGGQSWSPKSVPIWSTLRKVIFINKDFGWIIGGEESTPSFGSILLTTDGGETWSDHNIEESNAGWNDISVITKNLIYIGGFKGVYKSTDGGYNWVKKGGTNWTTTVFFIDSLIGWFGNTLGGLYKTTDGGDTWFQVADMDHVWHKSIKFISSNVGYLASGGLHSEKGLIYKTVDGGISWELKDSIAYAEYKSIEVQDSLNAIVVGTNGLYKYTTDGGESWLSDYVGQDDCNGAIMQNEEIWVVGGGNNYGKIYKKEDVKFNEMSTIFTKSSLTSISFHNNQNGVCAGANGTVLMTSDSGESWENIDLFSVDFTSVDFINEDCLYFAGRMGEFVKTVDGGNNWNISYPFSQYSDNKIKFFSETIGYSLTEYGALLKTPNGGTDWFETSDYGMYDFFFVDSLNGWTLTNPLETDYSIILNTTDGGLTWSSLEFQIYVDGIFFLDKNVGWLSSPNKLYKSLDGGTTWNLVEENLGFNIKQLLFTSEDRGYFLTKDFSNYSLTSVKYTNDGGESFSSIVDYTLLNYMMLRENKLWVSGENGHILEVNVDMLTDISNREEPLISNYYLFQNYPNPFNPETVISYRLQVMSEVLLKIYDVLGREVATLVNKEQQAGSYEVQFDASGLTSGIYFYKLQSGGFIESRKMILLK